ncbi:hypothetical protein PLESTB_001236100 [Pleodorina starrii]|uniref:hydroxyacylglutathione hydrolase n=1 Tax=Pleodorina starrii TaxID=330485 RepID=A0A9W6BST9_9CHLO|nr:hypothetical protein PLESTM_000223700 [Pleodorina starrii]GLC57518.1 hypothetical protein PLESTB_001236100 [Pleodorina starrii]
MLHGTRFVHSALWSKAYDRRYSLGGAAAAFNNNSTFAATAATARFGGPVGKAAVGFLVLGTAAAVSSGSGISGISGRVAPFCSTRGRSSATNTTTTAANTDSPASSHPSSSSSRGVSPSPSPMAMEVVRVPCLADNYVWLLREPSSGRTAVVDPAELHPVVSELERRGWSLDTILNTHHHWDHVGANEHLKRRFPGLQVVGPRADKDRIPGIDVQVGDGDSWQFGSLEVRVFDTPGHTRGHITFWVPQAGALFPGDTLFALGCGRLFEGSPRQMWSSLSKLLPLPDDTRVYCAHEYTAANARFAVTVDPTNTHLAERKARVDEARAKGEATVPSLLGEEKATNPFLRPGDSAIRQQMGMGPEAEDWQVFAAVRAAKDRF